MQNKINSLGIKKFNAKFISKDNAFQNPNIIKSTSRNRIDPKSYTLNHIDFKNDSSK